MLGKVILFKQVNLLVRPMFPAFQGNVAIYLVSLIARLRGPSIDLLKIWAQQGISVAFRDQVRIWAVEVNAALQESSKGRMISEWAKKEGCWRELQKLSLTPISVSVPELPVVAGGAPKRQ